MRRRAALTLTGTVLAATLLAACSAPRTAEPATPEGWQRVGSGALSFAVPGDWVEVPQPDPLWSVGWSTDADPDAGSVLLVGAPALGEDGAEQALDSFVAGAQVAGWGYGSTAMSTPVDEDTLEVRRNDFSYDDVAGVFWAAADPGSGSTVGLQLTGRDLPEDVVRGIEESIVVREAAVEG